MHLTLVTYLIVLNNSLAAFTDSNGTIITTSELFTMPPPSLLGKLEHPLSSIWDLPDPWPIDTIKPKIVFYKLGVPTYEMAYDVNPKDAATHLKQTGFLNSEKIIFITHGFHNDITIDWMKSYKDTLLNLSQQTKHELTVAEVGWGNGANIILFEYRTAASNVMTVGPWLGNYTKAIKEVNPKIFLYGVGHSLGAHVMGVAGRTSKSFDRITGKNDYCE